MTALKWLGHLSLQGIRLWNVCMLKVYHWGIRFTPFCLDCFSFSLSNSPCQHLPSVPTQLGSIQLSCPESEREGKWNNVFVCDKEREVWFVKNKFFSFFFTLFLMWVQCLAFGVRFCIIWRGLCGLWCTVPNLSSWCCARCNLALNVAVQYSRAAQLIEFLIAITIMDPTIT